MLFVTVSMSTFVSFMPESANSSIIGNDEINLRALVLALRPKRKSIALSGAAALVLATSHAFLIVASTFESSVLLPPAPSCVSSTDPGAATAILGSKESGSADADLYQCLMSSRADLNKLLYIPVPNMNDTGAGRKELLYHILGIDTTKRGAINDVIKGQAKSVGANPKKSGTGGTLEITFSTGSPLLAQKVGEHCCPKRFSPMHDMTESV